ncbi:MAG: GHKL domain-containing protein [Lachnospiraceae bacterium]|nr:GHKL domain-containing protein [Lachnospiraceae bacterium]
MHDFSKELLTIVIDFLTIILILGSSFSNTKITENLKKILPIIPIFILKSLINLFVPSIISLHIISYAIDIIIVMMLFKKQFLNSIYLYFLSYTFCVIIQLCILLFFNPVSKTIHSDTFIYLGSFITILIELIIYRFAPVYKLYLFIESKSIIIKYIITNLFLISVITVLTLKSSTSMFFENFILFAIPFVVMVISSLELYKKQQEITKKDKQLYCYTQYIPIVEELISAIRIRQHDFDNEIQSIKMLPLSCPDYASLVNELNSYSDYLTTSTKFSHLLKINLKLVAGFLYKVAQDAEKKEPPIHINIINYNLTTNVKEYDLIDMLSILIDNALEASPTEEITFTLNSYDSKIFFKTENKGDILTLEHRHNLFSKGYTTKSQKQKGSPRGLGLYKLKNLVDSYDGKIYLYNDFNEKKERTICFEIEV